MSIGKFVGGYLLVGLALSPFVYTNNAMGYRPESTAYKVGQTSAGVITWPSYLFSFEPEIDASTLEKFQNSIVEIIQYRKEKLFAGNDKMLYQDIILMTNALGSCFILDGFGQAEDKEILSLITTGKPISKELAQRYMDTLDRFDGTDFKDFLDEGMDCVDDLKG